MWTEFFKFDRFWVANLNHTGRSHASGQRHTMDTLSFLEEVEWRIHVCSGVCSHGEFGDICNISKLNIQRPFNQYRWVIGPVNHSRPQRNRNVNPFICHLLIPLCTME